MDIQDEVAALLVEDERERNPGEYVRRKSDFLNRNPELAGAWVKNSRGSRRGSYPVNDDGVHDR